PAEQALLSKVRITAWNRIAPQPLPTDLTAVIRYHATPHPCRWRADGDGVVLQFDTPCAVTSPGQLAALYSGNEIVGGGTIARVELCR
ncbi:MAG: hypothetical protein Q9M13_00450, partial [Mariprofundales bacterium]|nr:hypothetical protein [Mariprofundales bacterium]